MGIAVSSERGTRPTQDAPSPKIIPEYTHGRRDRAPRTDKVRAFPPRDPFFSRLSFFFFLSAPPPPSFSLRRAPGYFYAINFTSLRARS